MKVIATILLFLFCFTLDFAQTNKIDSLNRLIQKATSDTAKINLSLKIVDHLIETNLDSGIIVADKVIADAKRTRYSKGEADARLDLAIIHCFKGNYPIATEQLKAVEKLFKTSADSSGFGRLYSGYGLMYGMQSKYDSALFFYEKVAAIAKQIGDTKMLGNAYQNLAISYQMQSNYMLALFYQQEALKIAEKHNDISTQAYGLINMANTFNLMGDTVRSEQFNLKAIQMAKAAEMKNVELYAYSNLATLYSGRKKYQKAYDFAIEAAALGKAMGDQGIEAASLSKGATAQADMGNTSEAELLANRAIGIAIASNQPLNQYQANAAMGHILKLKGNYAAAIPYYEKGFQSLSQADMYEYSIGDNYRELSECYEKTGNFSKALTAFKIVSQIADSVHSKENIRKATELTMNFEFEKKEQAAEAYQQRTKAQAQARQLALSIGLLFVLILASVAYYAYRNKQKANALLQLQKEEIQRTLTELRNTQAQLIQREKMASLGELTAGIAHEIQNPLNFVNNFSEVSVELLNEAKEQIIAGNEEQALSEVDDAIGNLEKVVHHGKRADAIVKGMLQHSRQSTGRKEPTNINALTEEYLRLSYHGMRAKDKSFNVTIQTEFDPSTGKMNVIAPDMGRVFLNLFNNAFYAVMVNKKQQLEGYVPIVSVNTRKLNDKIEIQIQDNGIGISQKYMGKIFQPFFTTKATGEGTGLGLSLSYDIVKAHGGEIRVESKEGEGATFIILLPIS